MAVSSDPQYPWYDGLLPAGLTTEDEIKANSERQISQQYESMNQLASERNGGAFPLQGVIINGDLTAFGHEWQFSKYTDLLKLLKPKFYPGLGNHDYSNNVDDTYNNNAASRMVDFMYNWIKEQRGGINFDFNERGYYLFPELRIDYTGSLSYSFNIGSVHYVQLQNFPSYKDEWNTWNFAGARRDYYFITRSLTWLRNDLAQARNRGEIIIVNLHDYADSFVDPFLTEFNNIIKEYGVSAVFSGHIHSDCGYDGIIVGTNIPHFRSGAASYQDYLVTDIDTSTQKMIVRKRHSTTLDGVYEFEAGKEWTVDLVSYVPSPPLPIPPLIGYVTFFNEGGFVAKFYLQYTYNGEVVIINSPHLALGNKMTYEIPPTATGVWVVGYEQTGLAWEGWRTVFDIHYDAPPNRCYKLYGTTLNPKWNNDCQ